MEVDVAGWLLLQKMLELGSFGWFLEPFGRPRRLFVGVGMRGGLSGCVVGFWLVCDCGVVFVLVGVGI